MGGSEGSNDIFDGMTQAFFGGKGIKRNGQI